MSISARENIQNLRAYETPQIKARIKLNSNESPWPLPDKIIEDIERAVAVVEFNRYPDASSRILREEVSRWLRVGLDNVLVGSGSNEMIQCIFLAFGGMGRTLMTFVPTYSMASKIAAITDTEEISVPLKENFSPDIRKIVEQLEQVTPNIIYVCNPNNPTGTLFPRSFIMKLLEMTETLVVVDEAYGEFCSTSVIDLINRHANLAVVKTFSKVFRLAGARVGILVASEPIIKEVQKVKLPYNLNALSQTIATIVLRNKVLLWPAIKEIVEEREKVIEELEKIEGVVAVPSQTNFILFKTPFEGNTIYEELLRRDVLVRNFSNYPYLKGYLRVTIGTKEENQKFLAALTDVLENRMWVSRP